MTNSVDRSLLKLAAKSEGISEEQLKDEIEFYNADFSAYGNEIYERISSRVAHWINYRVGGWFTKRIDLFLDILKSERNVLVVDIGFSIPYLKLAGVFADREDIAAILVEKFESAKRFYELTKQALPETRDKHDTVVIVDIEQDVGRCAVIAAVRAAIAAGGLRHTKVLVVATELIEHLDDGQTFWSLCSEIQAAVPLPVEVFVSLPVCDSIPSHGIAFRTKPNAISYLFGHMTISEEYFLMPPADLLASSFLKGCVCVRGKLLSM